jgi:hypothetical protein
VPSWLIAFELVDFVTTHYQVNHEATALHRDHEGTPNIKWVGSLTFFYLRFFVVNCFLKFRHRIEKDGEHIEKYNGNNGYKEGELENRRIEASPPPNYAK